MTQNKLLLVSIAGVFEMLRLSCGGRLDDYKTVRALRREAALYSMQGSKPAPQYNKELAIALSDQVTQLHETMNNLGIFSPEPKNIKKNVKLMHRIREEFGNVLYTCLLVANNLNIDISKSVQERLIDVKLKENNGKSLKRGYS